MNTETEEFFEELSQINKKYPLKYPENEFNLFTALLNINDEVNLHSKFIYELIREDASHSLSRIFIKKLLFKFNFLKLAELIDNNYYYYVTQEKDHIDLKIEFPEDVIIIENKIYAQDQPRQLSRYYNAVKSKNPNKNIHMIYLTIDGHSPSKDSIGNLYLKKIPIIKISYRREIINWIRRCKQTVHNEPRIKMALEQYLTVIEKLTGDNAMRVNARKEQEYLLENNGNYATGAYSLFRNWRDICHATEIKYWEKLKDCIQKEYDVLSDEFEYYSLDTEKFNLYQNVQFEEMAASWWEKTNHKYGIQFPIYEDNNGVIIVVRIEKSNSFDQLYFGVVLLSEKKFKNISKETNINFYKKIQLRFIPNSKIEYKDVEPFIVRVDLNPRIEFSRLIIAYDKEGEKNPTQELKLFHTDSREQIVEKHWTQIENFIKAVEPALPQLMKELQKNQ